MKNKLSAGIIFTAIFILTITSCSINKIAVHLVADALSGSGSSTVFTGDDDPELIAAALPFALKMYESLLRSDPRNDNLLLTTASGYISYANAFLQSPAELMGYEQKAKKDLMLNSAVGLYRRGSGYASVALEVRHPGFSDKMNKGDWAGAMKDVSVKDVSLLYWKAAAVLGEFSIDTFNPKLMLRVPTGVACLAKALSLDPKYNRGSIHDLLISVFASMPDSLIYRADDLKRNFSVYKLFKSYYEEKGRDFDSLSNSEKAAFHLERAVLLSKGLKASPFVSYATSVCVKEQNYKQFKELLDKALSINIESNPDDRLVNVIAQRKAHWYLDHRDNFFILP